MSQIYLLHAVLPGMKEAGWGRFVHIGSATAKEPEGAIHHVDRQRHPAVDRPACSRPSPTSTRNTASP